MESSTATPISYKPVLGQIRDVLADRHHGYAMMYDVPQADGSVLNEQKIFFSFNTFRLPARYADFSGFGPKLPKWANDDQRLVAPDPGDWILALVGENERDVTNKSTGEVETIKSPMLSAWTLRDLRVHYRLERGTHVKWGGAFDEKIDMPSNDLFDALIINFPITKTVRTGDGRELSSRLMYKVMNPDGVNFDDKWHQVEQFPKVPKFLLDAYNAARDQE